MTKNLSNILSPAPSGVSFATIQTSRLDLVAATPESLRCQIGFGSHMRVELGAILDAEVPESWPHENWEAHVLDYMLNLIADDPEASGWCRYILLRGEKTRTLIGTVGSGFPKAEMGEAEIGYGLLEQWQRQGFAAEAVIALLPWFETRRPVRAFVAQTFPHLRGSIRVLEKTGFEPAGSGFDEGAILFRRMCAGSRTTSQ